MTTVQASPVYNGMPATDLTGLSWQKSPHSGAGNCVEFARVHTGEIALRDSKHPHGPALIFSVDEVRAWLDQAKCGDLDHLSQ